MLARTRLAVRSAPVALAACALAVLAHAHQARVAMTTVLFNDRTERIEVMHRFFLHDAEHVATALAGAGADLIARTEDRQRFAVYVHERFALEGADDAPLPLALVGAEVDGDALWVYQAARYPARAIAGLTIDQRALRDVWPDQVDTVNVERSGKVHTLTFRDGSGAQRVEF